MAPVKNETRNVVWVLFIDVPGGTKHILLSTENHRRRINISVHDMTVGKIAVWFPVLGGLLMFTIIVPRPILGPPILLGAFAKLHKTTVSIVMSVCLIVGPHGTTRLPLDGFSWNKMSEYFSKVHRENKSSTKIRQVSRLLYLQNTVHLWLYLVECPLEWEMFQTKVVEKIKIQIL
jgi:hypothetical protein